MQRNVTLAGQVSPGDRFRIRVPAAKALKNDGLRPNPDIRELSGRRKTGFKRVLTEINLTK